MARLSKPERTQLWLQRLARFADSDLTVAAFCQRENVSVPSFYQLKRRLTSQIDQPPKRRSQQAPGFAELKVVNSVYSAPAQATLPNGVTLALGSDHAIAALIVDRLLQHYPPSASEA